MRRRARIGPLLLALVLGLVSGLGGIVLPGTPGLAQLAPAPEPGAEPARAARDALDYRAWEAVAGRAEAALAAGRASDQALLGLRRELVAWRELFTRAGADGAARVETLQAQIETLGPPPGDGQDEPALLRERRGELTRQMARARAPLKAAQEAGSRAEALIGEIDAMLRARKNDMLFQIGPTPLNVAAWPQAVADFAATLRAARAEIRSAWGSDIQKAELRRALPLVIGLSVLGAALVLRGRAWVIRFGAGIRAHSHGHLRGVWGFVLSLGQVAAPLAGIYALVEALNRAGILGLRGQVMTDSLPLLGLSAFVAAWLGNRVFGVGIGTWSFLSLSQKERSEGRMDAALLGLFYGLFLFLQAIAGYEGWSGQTRVILGFPLLLASGLALLRLGHLLRRHGAHLEGESEARSFLNDVLALAGRLVMAAGVLGPLLAAIGYDALAQGFVFRTAMTLALVGGLAVLHRFFTNLYGLVMGLDRQVAAQALMPVLASLLAFLAALPVAALIWGARVVDLWDLWGRVRQGVQIGSTRISPAEFFTFLAVFAIGFALTRLIQGLLRTTVLPKTGMDIGGRNAVTAGVGYLGIFLAALAAITSAGIDLSSLAIVAGALSVGIGFGLQNVVSNFVSGIILLIERPISEGDWIEVGGQQGYVRDISVRSTRIETFDRTDVIVPNADLISGQVTNFTRGDPVGRVIVPVGVAYGSDTRRVEAILRQIAGAHPQVKGEPGVVFRGFGADALEFEIRAILNDINYGLGVRSEINHEIARRFAEEGIEIPFAQRDIWLRNPETLRGAGGVEAGATAARTRDCAPASPAERPEPPELAKRGEGNTSS